MAWTASHRPYRSGALILVLAPLASLVVAPSLGAQTPQWVTTAYGIVTDELHTPVPGASVLIHVFDPATPPGPGAPGDSPGACPGAEVGGGAATSARDGTFARRLEARAAAPPTACLRLDVTPPPAAAVTHLTLTTGRVPFWPPTVAPAADSIRLLIQLPWRGAAPPTRAARPRTSLSPAEELALLEARVPGFGGYYVSGPDVTVFLTDIATAAAVNAFLVEHFRQHPPAGLDPASLQLGYRPARFTYQQLDGWRAALARAGIRGVLEVRIRADWNRVQVMVRGGPAARRARQALEHLRIPAGAVMIVSPPST